MKPLRELPQAVESEELLLGCLLLNSDDIYSVINILSPQDFYSIKNKEIYRVMVDMFEAGEKIDIVSVSQRLKDKKFEAASYLTELINNSCLSFHLVNHAKIIKDKSLRRQLIAVQFKNEEIIYNETKEINSVLAEIQKAIFSITPLRAKSNKINDIIKDLDALQADYSEKYANGKDLIGLSCGFSKIDNVIDGLRPGHLWVIGGWLGTGKTSFALNIISNLLEQNAAISIITTEMSQIDLVAKLIGIKLNVSVSKIIKGKQDSLLLEQIEREKELLKNKNLEIHNEFDIDRIVMQIRRDFYTRKIKFVLVDYIQKIKSDKYSSEVQLLDNISSKLSNLAQELKITVLLISQISNEAHKGQSAGAGFRGSGQIEGCADLAILLKREKDKESPDQDIVPVKVIITKNKFGFDGAIDCQLTLKSGIFKEV
jgi:replicative DNA helicase